MRYQKTIISIVFAFALVTTAAIVTAAPAQAAIVECGNADNASTKTGCRFADLFNAAANLVNYMLSGGAVIAVGGVVYGGYLMVTSAGNAAKQGSGKKAVTNSMIGLAIILVAFLLVKSLFSVLGFKPGTSPIEDLNQLQPGQGFNLINITTPSPTPTPAPSPTVAPTP